jgi:soluble lytic murein transglycosylase-like protein
LNLWRAVWLPVLLCLTLGSTAARADVWAYIDARGVAHFSAERLDDRYELFLKGGTPEPGAASLNASASAHPAPAAPQAAPIGHSYPSTPTPALSPASAPSRLLTYLEQSPRYKAVQHLLKDAALTHGIDHALLKALIAAESGFDTHAVSPKGAVGLMQLISATAERYGVKADRTGGIEKKLTDPQTNLRAGSRYLRDLLAMFPGRLDLAVAAYNAGEGAVQRAGNKIPNYPETQNYVKTVLQLYAHLKPPAPKEAPELPAAIPAPAVTPSPVRPDMMGGASGRGNMPPPSGRSLLRPETGM